MKGLFHETGHVVVQGWVASGQHGLVLAETRCEYTGHI